MAIIESQIEACILSQKKWNDLDNRMKDLIGSSQEYDKKVIQYSIRNQLRYRGSLVRYVKKDEREYYEELLKYSRDNLMLFPYHLSDFIITGMRVTPFQYYLSTITQIIDQEKSYDTLPNFTAADCLRLLGIGRNQYIDIMNQLRSTHRKFLGIGVKKNVRDVLPIKPSESISIEPWWIVNAGYITEDDVRFMVSPAERIVIDKLVSPDGMTNQIRAFEVDEKCVRSLYLKGLVYLDVPIYDEDLIVVPPLEGFVMNRVTGDYFETLLYKIFVSIDQNTSVGELSHILQIDTQLVKNAVSMYCRLGFAYKKNIGINLEQCHGSWRKLPIPKHRMSEFMSELAANTDSDHGVDVNTGDNLLTSIESSHGAASGSGDISKMSTSSSAHHIGHRGSIPHSASSLLSGSTQIVTNTKKIVFFYDSTLAAFLMMGNLSSKLKNHAVTMFEVGKLPDESIDSLLLELSKIKGDTMEDDGFEAKRYYIHALMLYRTIQYIRTDLHLASDIFSNVSAPSIQSASSSRDTSNDQIISDEATEQRIGLDLVRVESLSNLDASSCQRLLKKNYQLIISAAPLSHEVKLNAVTGLPHLGPGSPLINSLWFKLYIYHITGYGPPTLLLSRGYRLTHLPEIFYKYDCVLITPWNRDPSCVPICGALLIINETLIHFPVLIQAYPIQPQGGNLMNGRERIFVPLPLGSSSQNDATKNDSLVSVGSEDNFHNNNNKNSLVDDDQSTQNSSQITNLIDSGTRTNYETNLAVVKLSESIDLTRICGYITLLRSRTSCKADDGSSIGGNYYESQRQRETCRNSQSFSSATINDKVSQGNSKDSNENYTLFDCHFGVPLFDRFLNKQVRDRISRKNLCDSRSLEILVKSTDKLTTDIKKFLDDFGPINRESVDANIDAVGPGDQRHYFTFPEQIGQTDSSVPLPPHNLFFDQGQLSIYESKIRH